MIALKRPRQKYSTQILSAERIEDRGNDCSDEHQSAADPYSQRQPFKRETTDHPPTGHTKHQSTSLPGRSRIPPGHPRSSSSPGLSPSIRQMGYSGSSSETWPDRPPTVPVDRRSPHRRQLRPPTCPWPIQRLSPEPYSTYRLPTPTTRLPHRPARRSTEAP